MDTPKVINRKCLCLCGDDYQVVVFKSASRPNYPEPSFIVFYEDAYGDQSFDFVSLPDLRKRFKDNSGKELSEFLDEAGITLEDLD